MCGGHHYQGHCGCCCGGHGGHHRGSCCCQSGHGCGCDDTCSCRAEEPHGFHRRFRSREERAAELEAYLKELEAEAQGVREALADMRKG